MRVMEDIGANKLNLHEELMKNPKFQTLREKVLDFLKKCDVKGLLKIDLVDKDYFERSLNRANVEALSGIAHIKFESIHDENPDRFLPQSFDAFQIVQTVNSLKYNIQEFASSLKIVFDPDKIVKFDSNELGTLFSEILDKAGITRGTPERKELWEIFKIPLRNAFSHNDYDIDLESKTITWFDKKKVPHEIDYSNSEILQVIVVNRALLDYTHTP
jgi:hypothetical protein